MRCWDDLGLDDNVVYKPDLMYIGELVKDQRESGGGSKQRHGRPPPILEALPP